jgi:hypothetical protein
LLCKQARSRNLVVQAAQLGCARTQRLRILLQLLDVAIYFWEIVVVLRVRGQHNCAQLLTSVSMALLQWHLPTVICKHY